MLAFNGSDRPRMTEELKEIGLEVGHRRAGRLMRQNDISVVRYHCPAGDYGVICREGSIQIAAASIAHMTTRKSYASTGSKCQ